MKRSSPRILCNFRQTPFFRSYSVISRRKTEIRQPAYRDERSSELGQVKQKFDYFLIVDFEATCDVRTKVDPQEIIEFPCLKLNAKTLEIDSKFHQYVKPEAHPILTPFCMDLTGINQSMIEKQPNFLETLSLFQNWLLHEGLVKNVQVGDDTPPYNYVFVTCGEWDFKWLLHRCCQYVGIETPTVFRQWINVKKPFYATTKVYPRGLMHMLEILNLTPVGRHHSGLDDSTNVANVVRELCRRGCVLEYSSKVD